MPLRGELRLRCLSDVRPRHRHLLRRSGVRLDGVVCAVWGVGRQGKEAALAIGHTCMDSKDIISVNKGIGQLILMCGDGWVGHVSR